MIPNQHSAGPGQLRRQAVIRLVSVPPSHPYVTAIRPSSVRPVDSDRVDQWEPDPIFQIATLTGMSREFDLVHVHFGFDGLTETSARQWVQEIHRTGRHSLVLTVHDLRNPHHAHRDQHDAVLAELIAGAAAVITLTAGAAVEIGERFGRHSVVIPHPTLTTTHPRSGPATEPGLVTLHLKSLRRNLADPIDLIRAAGLGAARAGGRLRVDLHPGLVGDPRLAGIGDTVGELDIELSEHERFDDEALEHYLRRAQVTVLPHRWGTHSGWLELARDLGTRVVAPDCGYFRDQWTEVVEYRNNERDGLDPDSLADAVTAALQLPPVPPADRPRRLADADQIRAAHAELYRSVQAAKFGPAHG